MISKFFILLIRAYQLCISPFQYSCCRYYPSCSEYSKQCIEKYGFFSSIALVFKRIVSCHPFSKKEFWDPVK